MYHLTDAAQQWYFQLERDEGEPNWRNFKVFVNLRFGPSTRHNPLGELKELRQTGTVEEYQRNFLAILCRVKHRQPRQQVQLFTPGLVEPIRTDVELQNPASLQMAMALARAYERRALAAKEVLRPTSSMRTSTAQHHTGQRPLHLPRLQPRPLLHLRQRRPDARRTSW